MNAVVSASVPRHRVLLLTIILASYSMLVIDNSIIITGLPSIRHGLGFSAAALSWVQNAYTLTFGGLLLLGARAGDLMGRRRMLIVGLTIFSAASLAIGLADSAVWLVGARAVQGVGAAILAPSTLALLSISFAEGPQRCRALGWYGAVGGITASVGRVVGGIVADLVSWRAGFFINVPIGALLVWGARRHITETPRRGGHFDVAGAVLSTLGMALLVYGLVHAAEESWAHWGTAVPLLAGGLLLVLFLLNEKRAVQPILPLRLFANRQRAGAHAARVLFIGSSMGFFFYTTQYLQGVLDMRPLWAGIAFLPSMLANFAAALAAPRLAQRFGNAWVLAGGLAVCVLGTAWLGQLGPDTPLLLGVGLPMLLIGVGMGASLSPLTIASMEGIAAEDAGSASGLVNAAHQLGGSLGLALLVAVYAAANVQTTDVRAELAHRVAAALSAGALMLAAALAIVFVCVVRRPAEIGCGVNQSVS